MIGARYLVYVKMALSGMSAFKTALKEARADGEVTTEEKFMIAMAFFMGLFATVRDDK